ncbi:hypothetical protein Tel_02000 [Candidatus Tenderia electrophaga]|jgi:hypothetical protein|uniref:DUF4142 domain-containing protein n=1 Tax=Candidatus Tenderia electrophaga TaxID=1748243 RepID=A0A0S2TA16_9GAMM|nr:hypothetical protein Tel_02000 [Candidatus Tenderia electrophaga]
MKRLRKGVVLLLLSMLLSGNVLAATTGLEQQAGFTKLLEDFREYKVIYETRLGRGANTAAMGLDNKATPEQLQQMEDGAMELAAKGNYKAAGEVLVKAKEIMMTALVGMLEQHAARQSGSFATEAEQYQYELARYRNFEELVPLAKERMRPTKESVQLVNGLVEKGKKFRMDADQGADQGDYARAVLDMQSATRQIRRALIVSGIR